MKVALLCGGPSLERGISLNSARSVLDHLSSGAIEIIPVYFDSKKRAYRISTAQLYSNTPSDFDFKLKQTASPLSERSLVALLKNTDMAFPSMHGAFGEDGGIQRFLEKHKVPFIGAGSAACEKAFDKFRSNEYIGRKGFFTLPSIELKKGQKNHEKILEMFFKKYKIKRAVVKPANGGSSIGVFSVSNASEALAKANYIFGNPVRSRARGSAASPGGIAGAATSRVMDARVVVEPFATGAEFTMIILQNRLGLPVALPPTEIETDYTENQIFDFRRKYLPTRQVTWHCPPRFDNEAIERIQAQGEQLFALFGMRDFARFDGWILPDGNIWFCDFNPISGMEQNSFLFQQASRIGMTHADVLRHILESACRRHCVRMPDQKEKISLRRKPVDIIFGGDNSERQVSLMSGTNVWLKLRKSKKYEPHPYLLDTHGAVWRLPYHLALNHTVEEIEENCKNYALAKKRLADFEERARLHLGLDQPKNEKEFFEPEKLTLKKLIAQSSFLFIALHGGDGENGTLQKMLAKRRVKFNGPGEKASRLCMDKWLTSKKIETLGAEGVRAISGKNLTTAPLLRLNDRKIKILWENLKEELDAETLIAKPRADGCTTGVAHLYSASDLGKYLKFISKKAPNIPKQTFKGQCDAIEMPPTAPHDLLFEKFVETDALRARDNRLVHERRNGWIEITIGVIEKNGKLHAFNPSITIAEGEVLTVEEKFQGGTGVNITPPPPSIMKPDALARIKKNIEAVSARVDIRGYSRIDAFTNVATGDLLIIEINTLPGLTPSTVFYQQALAEKPPIFPKELLELLISNKKY